VVIGNIIKLSMIYDYDGTVVTERWLRITLILLQSLIY
jgi:hypothetical protein